MSTGMMSLSRVAARGLQSLRGPRPPALVCWICKREIKPHYQNPFLVSLAAKGQYHGDTTGGSAACDDCDRAHADLREERQRASSEPVNVPVPERDTTLESLVRTDGNRRAIAAAERWLSAPDHDLYFYGVTGTGKSKIACALANAVAATRGPVVFVRVAELLRRLRESAFDGSSSSLGRTGTYTGAALLVLDDVGAEKGTEFARATLVDIYAYRVERGRPTIWTSNVPLGLSEFEARQLPAKRRYPYALCDVSDDRLVSRINGHAEVVEVTGDDFRLSGWRDRRRSVR